MTLIELDERSSVDEKGNGGSESSVGIDEMHRRYMSTDLDGASGDAQRDTGVDDIIARVTRSTLNRAHIVAAGLRALCATLRLAAIKIDRSYFDSSDRSNCCI